MLAEAWRKTYNRIRPHSSLGYRPPAPEAQVVGTFTQGLGHWNIDPKYDENYPRSAPLHRLVLERLEDPYYGLQKCNKKPLRTIAHGSKFSYQDDYIYASNRLIPKLVSCDVVKDPIVERLSDHIPVLAVFRV